MSETNGSGAGERVGLLALARERAGSPVTPGCAAFTERAFWLRFTDEVAAYFALPATPNADDASEGCDCTTLCSMGPTCPGGMAAGLPGSGCWRTDPAASTGASEGLSEAERADLRFAFQHYHRDYDEGSRAYEVVERIAAARESAAATRARAEEGERIAQAIEAERDGTTAGIHNHSAEQRRYLSDAARIARGDA